MDIVQILKSAHLKASFNNLSPKHKLFLLTALLTLISTLLPQVTHAAIFVEPKPVVSGMVFNLDDPGYHQYIYEVTSKLTGQHQKNELRKKAERQLALARKLEVYLQQQKSPLAKYAQVLVNQPNWKKIIALSNAESSLCKRYPEQTANCWGVGGSNLWDMGSTLGEGVVAMNKFLNNYPLRSKLKYSQMTFEQMNGLYKQPAKDHWVFNNKVVYKELAELESSIK